MTLLTSCALAHERTCDVTTFDEFAARYPAALCGYDSPRVAQTLYADLHYWPRDCARDLGDALEQQRFAHLRAAIAAGLVTFRADDASRCLCALGAGRRQLELPYACETVIAGGPVGSPCSVEEDCAAGTRCGARDASGCSSCFAGGGALGAPCTRFVPCDGAGYPLFCDDPDADGTGVCHPRVDLGEPCTMLSCVPGAACGADGRCFDDGPATVGVGELCDEGRANCARGLVCVADGTRHRCAVPLDDGTCRLAYLDTSDCVPGYECDATVDGARGACVPLSHAPDTCPGWCPDGLHCGLAAECVRPLDLGEACEDARQCVSGRCVDGRCATAPLCR